ncbi:MAG: sigma-70 family RNA polymerase sigma factor [Polyangiaceae bacterium]
MPDAPEPSDAELFARLASSRLEREDRRRAQTLLYVRHVRYLYGVLRRQRGKLLALAGISAEDLVQETFHRAFERAHTFDPANIEDPERARRRTRAWLGRIAQNLLCDQLERVREVSATPYLERVSAEELDPPATESVELSWLSEGLERLSDREQDVLRVSALYQRAGEHQRLPNAVSAELAARWGTSNENIRAIRSRALRKLSEFVTARMAEEGVR